MDDQLHFRLSPCYIVVVNRNSVLFCGEEHNHLFEGEGYVRIVQIICGNTSAKSNSSISLDLKDKRTSELLFDLTDKGVLTTASSPDTPRSAYWESIGREPKATSIGVENLAPGCSELLKNDLNACGVEIGSPEDLLVITTDDYLRPEISRHAGRSRPWLITKPVGHTIWLGPLIIPGKTTCFNCLASALRRNRWLQRAAGLEERLGYLPQPSLVSLPNTIAIATGMISTVVAVYLATGSYLSLENTIMSLDTRTMSCTYNPVQSRLDCTECGRPLAGRGVRIEELHAFLSPLNGIVSRLQVCETLHGGLFHASGSFLYPNCPLKKRPSLHPGRSSGKGLTPHDAQVSCIAEAIERYSLTYQGTEPEELKTDLDDADVVPPNDILLFSQEQFRHRALWNSSHSELQWVPEPPPPLSKITWTGARSFVTDRRKLVPAGLVYMYFPFTNEPEFCNADTNGCAAGRTFAEAQLHALLELIERDAVAIWWYNRIRRPAVDLRLFGDSAILEIQHTFERQGQNCYVLDITTDLGIPACVALATAQNGAAPYFGCAAHPSPRVAAWKALSELSQVWFWSQDGGASEELNAWLATGNSNEDLYLEPQGMCSPHIQYALSIEEMLDLCVDRVVRAGIEPLYVDMTRPETGVPVARVLAPGLRHCWARFAPGRLYDVPVSLGWLKQKREERDLNPVACML